MPRLLVEIGAQITQLQAGLSQAGSQISAFVSRNQARLQELGEQFTKVGGMLSIGLTVPIVALGAAALVAFAKMDSLKRGLAAVAGGTAEAENQFKRLTKIAQLPGLGLEEVTKGTINLQAIGFTAEESEKKLQVFGNAVATVGKGRAEFERAIYGVQQLANTDFPLGEDLNILKDSIPQITPLLKEAFGTARTEDLQKMKISSKEVLRVITEGLGKLPAVSGGIGNSFENLSDSMSISLGKIGETLEKNFKVSEKINAMADAVSRLVDWFNTLNPIAQDFIIGVLGLTAAIGPFLLVLGSVIRIAPLVGSAITLIGGPFTILAAVVGVAALAIINNWDQVRIFILRSVSYITDGLADFMKSLTKIASWAGLDTLAKRFSVTADSLGAKSKVYENQANSLAASLTKVAAAQAKVNIVAKAAPDFTPTKKGKTAPVDNSDKSIGLLGSINGDNITQTSKGLEGLKGTITGLAPVVTKFTGDWERQIGSLNEQFQDIQQGGLNDFIAGIGEGIGGLASGTMTLAQVGGMLLNVIGDIAIKLGTAAIGIGTVMQAIQAAFTNPLGAVAGGIALIAIGAAIKGVASIVSGGGGSKGSASPASANYTTSTQAATTQTPAAAPVQVVGSFKVVGRDLVAVLNNETKRRV